MRGYLLVVYVWGVIGFSVDTDDTVKDSCLILSLGAHAWQFWFLSPSADTLFLRVFSRKLKKSKLTFDFCHRGWCVIDMETPWVCGTVNW